MASFQELKGHRDIKVFPLAYRLAMEIFNESKSFPKDERFSLTDQMRLTIKLTTQINVYILVIILRS
jgi:hypothetical protein